jgi:hypothetical protein
MAVEEVLALKKRYFKRRDYATGDFRYSFECGGRTVVGAFVSASAQAPPNPPNAYRITLLVPAHITVDGKCYITDHHGQRVGARGATQRGDVENRIILEALALKPSTMPPPALERTRPSHSRGNHAPSWTVSLSLGR